MDAGSQATGARLLVEIGVGFNPAPSTIRRSASRTRAPSFRLGEMSTGGYTLIDIPFPRQRMAHIHGGAEELGPPAQHGAALIVALVDNGMYGTIRMHQERHFPARPIATDLRNPDFVALAKACGAHGELVEETAQFAPVFRRAEAAGTPALLHLKLDPEAIAPSAVAERHPQRRLGARLERPHRSARPPDFSHAPGRKTEASPIREAEGDQESRERS